MRFLSFFKAAERDAMPSQVEMDAMEALIGEMSAAGLLLTTEGCLPTSFGLRLRHQSGEFTVTDGPFRESNEQIAGYAIFQADSKEDLIPWMERFATLVGDTEIELRALYEVPAYNLEAEEPSAGQPR